MFFRPYNLTPAIAFSMLSLSFLMSGCASNRAISHNAPVIAQTEPSSKKELKIAAETASTKPLSPQKTEPEPIQILGGVKNPGNIPYREGADLTFYLSQAGAPDSDEDSAKVQIIRGKPGKKEAQVFDLHKGTLPSLQGGDIVIVHPQKKTFIEKSLAVAASAAAILGTTALLILVV
ncbi:MAG: SLBB domain-containing protein [Bdellovibrionia bacterium]